MQPIAFKYVELDKPTDLTDFDMIEYKLDSFHSAYVSSSTIEFLVLPLSTGAGFISAASWPTVVLATYSLA